MRWLHVIRWRRWASWNNELIIDRQFQILCTIGTLTWMLHWMWWMMHYMRNRIGSRVVWTHSHWWAVLWWQRRRTTQHRMRDTIYVWVSKIVRVTLSKFNKHNLYNKKNNEILEQNLHTGLHDGLGPPDLFKVPGAPIGPLKLWFATGVELRRFHCSSSRFNEWWGSCCPNGTMSNKNE